MTDFLSDLLDLSFDGAHCPQCNRPIDFNDPACWGEFREESSPDSGNGVRAGTADYLCECGYIIEDVDCGS